MPCTICSTSRVAKVREHANSDCTRRTASPKLLLEPTHTPSQPYVRPTFSPVSFSYQGTERLRLRPPASPLGEFSKQVLLPHFSRYFGQGHWHHVGQLTDSVGHQNWCWRSEVGETSQKSPPSPSTASTQADQLKLVKGCPESP